MNYLQKNHLDMALFYQSQFKAMPWFKFKRRRILFNLWQKELDLMIKNIRH